MMSEKLENSARDRNLTAITYEDVLMNPSLWPLYRDERLELIKAGISIWMLRGPYNPDNLLESIVLDYYRNGKRVGYVAGSPEEGYFAYGPPIDIDESYPADKSHKITTDPEPILGYAQRKLIDYLDQTYAAEGL